MLNFAFASSKRFNLLNNYTMEEETLNIDTSEDVNDVDEGGEDTTDYKALVEQERAAREQAEAEANKWKDRFKKTKASENNNPNKWLDQESIKRMVDESVWVVKFYSENKDANQYQSDIEALVAKGIDRSQAFKFVLADKDPTLLLDDARRAQLNGNTALNGVPANLQGQKDPNSMTPEEIAKLSDAEFDKLFPSGRSTKKFYSDN